MCDCSNESNFITHSMRTAWLSSALKINFCLLTGIVLHLYRNEILLYVLCDVCVWASLLLNVFHWLCLFLARSIRYMRTVVEALKYLNKFLIRNFLFFSFLPQNFPPKRVSAFTFSIDSWMTTMMTLTRTKRNSKMMEWRRTNFTVDCWHKYCFSFIASLPSRLLSSHISTWRRRAIEIRSHHFQCYLSMYRSWLGLPVIVNSWNRSK